MVKIQKSHHFRIYLYLLLFLIWFSLRVYWGVGYYYEDGPGFVGDATQWSKGRWQPREYLAGLRTGTYIPVGFFLWIFGQHEWVLMIWPMLCSLLGMFSIVGIATILLDWRWGLLAGILFAIYPGDIFFSTVVMPDAIQCGWYTCSLFLLILAGGQMRWILILSGAAFGVAYLARENVLLFLPVAFVALFLLGPDSNTQVSRRPLFLISNFLGGIILILLLEGIYYKLNGFSFFHRQNTFLEFYKEANSARNGINVNLLTIPFTLFPVRSIQDLFSFQGFNYEQALHGLHFEIAVLVFVLLFILAPVRNAWVGFRETVIFAVIWFFWPVLYHEFGSQSLSEYARIHRLSRHLIVYSPAVIFLGVLSLCGLTKLLRSWKPIFSGSCVALYLLVQCFGSYSCLKVLGASIKPYQEFKMLLAATFRNYRGTVFADGDLGGFIDFYYNRERYFSNIQLFPLESSRTCKGFSNSMVVLNRTPGWLTAPIPWMIAASERLPCLKNIPDNWAKIFESSERTESIYQVP